MSYMKATCTYSAATSGTSALMVVEDEALRSTVVESAVWPTQQGGSLGASSSISIGSDANYMKVRLLPHGSDRLDGCALRYTTARDTS
jgi:hypothetical protein